MVLYNPQEFEKEILNFWEKNKIFEKLKEKNKKGKLWSFTDGPITANNPMGVHHAWGRTLKDMYQRFKAMQGYHQRYQNGFDCQGLWVEIEVEKENGFKSRKDIEKFGILNFVNACRERVLKYSKRITDQSIRLGQWMDWKNSYYTMSDKSNEYKWMFLKECYKRGWLYKGVDVVPWCARCENAESKHAIATEGYENKEDTAIYMQFPIRGKEKEYFLVFTTTPWTVPANVALAVHPDIYYVRVKVKDKIYIVAENCAEAILGTEYKFLDKFLGIDLIGQAYDMPYNNLSAQKSSIISGAKSEEDVGAAPHIVVEWTDVSEEEGTGIVHIAPGCGPEDYVLGKRERLPAPSPLDSTGKYKKGFGEFSGKSSVKMNDKIVEDLKKKGFLLKSEKYSHRYPHCTRCRTPLVFRLVPEWYISVDEIRPKLISENRKINWVPEQGQKYEETWLNNMQDWLISRKRYWGLPLPIWECECGHIEVIGSKAELKKKAVSGYSKLKELHRPWVDNVKIKCSKCKKTINRIVDTGDVWLDAGMIPFFTLDWLKNKKEFDKWYPADFVTECGPGQYRCWFYAMILHGVALTGKRPFKNVLTNELIKDETGREMHKSWGNAIWFDEAADKVGADVMRWLYSTSDIKRELLFGFSRLSEKHKILNVFWNFINYLQLNISDKVSKPKEISKEGQWILSRAESLKAEVSKALENFAPNVAANAIEDFFLNDLSRTYGQIIRYRINDKEVQYVAYNVSLDLLKLMAPFIPFTTERLYQNFFKKHEKNGSIHLFDWPKVNEKLINKTLEKEMSIVKDVVSMVLSLREKINRGIRWPVKEIIVVAKNKITKESIQKHRELIKQMTNCIDIKVTDRLADAEYQVKGNFSNLGPKFGKDVGRIIGQLSMKSANSLVNELEKNKKIVMTVDKDKFVLKENDLIIDEVLPKHIIGVKDSLMSVYLEKNETKEMIAMGYAREIMRKVQSIRKDMSLVKKDRIALQISAPLDIVQILESFKKEISEKVGAKTLSFEGHLKGTSFNIKDKKFTVKVKKV